MHLNASKFLQPVFDFLDGIIRDYSDILFMLFTYAAIPFLVWLLCGGLRRKFFTGERGTSAPPVVAIYLPIGLSRPLPEPLPPLIGQDHEPPDCGYDADCYRD